MKIYQPFVTGIKERRKEEEEEEKEEEEEGKNT
jgi:hypothetical protein